MQSLEKLKGVALTQNVPSEAVPPAFLILSEEVDAFANMVC